MLYRFICPVCKKGKEVDIPAADIKGHVEICEDCGNPMRRDWRASLHISDSDKAENIAETSWLKEGMKKRFSGKSQIYY